MTFDEDNLRFEFNDQNWKVVKYDESIDFIKIKNAVPLTKGVDFIGIKDDKLIVLIEVKDISKHRIKNKHRVEEGKDPLDVEFAQKVTGSISGIVGGIRNSTHHNELWRKCLDILMNKDKKVDLVLWLEEDSSVKNLHTKKDRRRNTFIKNLKKRGAWLTGRVFLASRNSNPYSESLTVNYI